MSLAEIVQAARPESSHPKVPNGLIQKHEMSQELDQSAPPLVGTRRLWRTAEVDHRVPLFRVWREHRDLAWRLLLRYWGVPNLQVINRHVRHH
jgi:hypothetical protein